MTYSERRGCVTEPLVAQQVKTVKNTNDLKLQRGGSIEVETELVHLYCLSLRMKLALLIVQKDVVAVAILSCAPHS